MSIHRKERAGRKSAWVVRWREGGRNCSRSFDRRRDADLFDAETRRRLRLGEPDPSQMGRITLSELALQWWQLYADEHLAPKTKQVYLELWARHVDTRIGGMELRRLTPQVMEQFKTQMQKDGVGDSTVVKTLALVSSVLGRGVIWGHLRSNPVAHVRKPPQRRRTTIVAISPAEVERLRQPFLARDLLRDAALISVLAYAGLRPGEALALRWSDIRARTILVERSISLGEVAPTKTRRVRTVRLLRPLAEDLARLAETVAASPGDLIFAMADGQPWNDFAYRNWRSRRFAEAVAESGVPIRRPYDLRYAFVSLLSYEGRPVTYVAAQAGHAPTMTLDTYGHVIDELEQGERVTAEEAIDRAHSGTSVPPAFPPGADPAAPEGPIEEEMGDLQGDLESPLADSNRRPPPYHRPRPVRRGTTGSAGKRLLCRHFVVLRSLLATPRHDGFSAAWVRTGCGPAGPFEAVSGDVR